MAKDSKVKDEVITETTVNNADSDALQFQFDKMDDFLSKYKNILSIIGGSILLIVALIFGGKYYLSTQNQEAQSFMFQAQYYLEADSLKKALNGDGVNLGFIEIAESYPFTDAANISNYCAGLIYLKQGKYDEAIEYLNKFGSNDLLLQARAYCLVGDAYMEKADYESAADYYEKASSYKPTKEFTPEYLMKQALAFEKANNLEKAISAYDKLINKYPNNSRFNDARKYKALLEEKVSN